MRIGIYEQSSLVLIKTLSPLHIGIGRTVGITDLPIARDGLKLPVIPASSLKGALRGCFDERSAKAIFGPNPMEEEQYAGALAVLDGYLLAIPARSLRGVWVLATSDLLLKRLKRLAHITGIKELVSENLWKKIEQLKERQILVSPTGMKKFSFGESPVIVLNEEFELEPIEYQELEQVASQLGLENPWRLVIIHDNILHLLVERSILRRARIRLKPETKTVETGALWTEEELPIETLFVTCFMYSKARMPKQKEKLGVDKVRELVENELFNKRKGYVIFGGHETIGRGLVKMSTFSQG
ncbi:MAG: type III-B CRISPR module RAMP protein Cmr4 [Desulfurococcales archaeon]|nr:type III-B CRISPR module RAMP protein Cmr4 [Desulfurococcales archaeon]